MHVGSIFRFNTEISYTAFSGEKMFPCWIISKRLGGCAENFPDRVSHFLCYVESLVPCVPSAGLTWKETADSCRLSRPLHKHSGMCVPAQIQLINIFRSGAYGGDYIVRVEPS